MPRDSAICAVRIQGIALATLAVCFIMNGCSSSKGGGTPPPPAGNELVVVTNEISNNISAYTMSSSSGTLTPVAGSPFSTLNSAGGLAIDPQGRFAYVTEFGNPGPTGVQAFTIASGTGVLTPVGDGLFAGDSTSSPQSVIEDPSGQFVYTANGGDNGMWAFSINSTTGALTQISGSPYSFNGNGPCTSLTMNPAGTFLYVLCTPSSPASQVLGFSVDPSTGALTALPRSPFSVPHDPSELFMHPSGNFLYIADLNNNAIDGYAISANGALSAVPGSPFAGGTEPQTLTVTPSGGFLYSASWQTGDVYGYSIDSTTGALTQLAGAPYNVEPSLTGIAVDQTGQFLLVGDSSSNVVAELPIGLGTGVPGTFTTYQAGTYPFRIAVITLP